MESAAYQHGQSSWCWMGVRFGLGWLVTMWKIYSGKFAKMSNGQDVVLFSCFDSVAKHASAISLPIDHHFSPKAVVTPLPSFCANYLHPLISRSVSKESTVGLILRWSRHAKIAAAVVQRVVSIAMIDLDIRVGYSKNKTVHLDSAPAIYGPDGIKGNSAIFCRVLSSAPLPLVDALKVGCINNGDHTARKRNMSLGCIVRLWR